MKQRSVPASLPAPVGGWNARDSLGNMAPDDAVFLTNFFPSTTDIEIRGGYTNYATGMTGEVETIFIYSGGTENKMFSVVGGNIYEVTNGGAVGSAKVTGLSNNRWQYVNISTPGGSFLVAFNGQDQGLRFDGTNWVNIPNSTGAVISSLTGDATTSTVVTATAHHLKTGNQITVIGASVTDFNVTSAPVTVTNGTTFTYASSGTPSATGATYTVIEGIGVDPATIIGVNLFKNRLWLTQVGNLVPYYLGTNSVAGPASQFPLQSIARKGGYIMSIGTWTFDGGYGLDDMLVFETSEGEVIIYNGLDPATADTWQLSGLWALGRPIGRRCLYKYAGDLIMISQDGLVPLSTGLQSSEVRPDKSLSAKIMYAFSTAVSIYGPNFGWETIYYPRANALIVNIPIAVGQQQQYVMNTITNSWCNFTNWNANTFVVFNDDLYFGSNGVVCKAWDEFSDNGNNIVAEGKQAFNYFRTPGILKRWVMMRPTLSSNGTPGVLAALNIDFDDTPITSPISYDNNIGSIWDSSLWDQALWSGGNTVKRQWQGVTGVGYCAAPRLKCVSNGIDLHWISTDLVMERGQIL